ncbi:hypothetical protein XOCgx_0662 [Xanthomonas oryzae pv. oryzicola]|nr:hypothetical protein XOCgx_0662 [Xanthomonas oryzae pv. oryzicola]
MSLAERNPTWLPLMLPPRCAMRPASGQYLKFVFTWHPFL